MSSLTLSQASKYLKEKYRMGFSRDTLSCYVRGDLLPILPAERGDDGYWRTTTEAVDQWAVERRKTKATREQLNVRIRESAHAQLAELCAFTGGSQGAMVEQALDLLYEQLVVADAERQELIAKARDEA